MSTVSSEQRERRRPYHHGDLRSALIRRAVEVVNADGVEALSLRALARDLGVSHTAPAKHFRSKGELLGAVARDGFEKLFASIRAAGLVRSDPVARLRRMAKAYVAWSAAHPAQHGAMRNLEVMRHADEEVGALLRAFYAEQRAAMAAAQASGWRAGTSLDRLMFQFVATQAGAAILLADGTYRSVMRDLTDAALVDLTIDAIFDAA